MLAEQEKKALKIFVKQHVIRKSEFKALFGGNGGAVINSLLEKGLIVKVSPIGETAYAITQKGIKHFEEITKD